ncbi:hypothetical protein GH733_018846, partial [Mirounga leonina]
MSRAAKAPAAGREAARGGPAGGAASGWARGRETPGPPALETQRQPRPEQVAPAAESQATRPPARHASGQEGAPRPRRPGPGSGHLKSDPGRTATAAAPRLPDTAAGRGRPAPGRLAARRDRWLRGAVGSTTPLPARLPEPARGRPAPPPARGPLALERVSATAAAAPDFQPLLDNGEPGIEVERGAHRALLSLRKLCRDSKGPSIRHRGEWLTPNEFQFVSGRETAKDWKRSIRHKGKSPKTLMSKGILQNRGRLADKRTVALPTARVLKKELTPSFSSRDGDSDGRGPACGRQPGLKQGDTPHVPLMRRRYFYWGPGSGEAPGLWSGHQDWCLQVAEGQARARTLCPGDRAQVELVMSWYLPKLKQPEPLTPQDH